MIANLAITVFTGGVQDLFPRLTVIGGGQGELHFLGGRVEVHDEVDVHDLATAHVHTRDALSVEPHTHGPGQRFIPVLRHHGSAVRVEPGNVRHGIFVRELAHVHGTAVEELRAAERGVVLPQVRDRGRELDQRTVHALPVDPRQLVVLAVRVVVTVLRAAQLITVQQHGGALGQQQGGQVVALLAGSQSQNGGIVRGTLLTAVPGAVVGLAVVVALTVGLVVLLVVRDQVAQREAVVGGHKVHGRERTAATVLVEIRGTGDPGRELTQAGRLATPEIAHGVTVLTVPFGPLRWEVAHLVTAGADVPRLGNELDLRDNGVLLHEFEERGELVHVVELSRQGRGQVEAETVHVHLGHPVAQ